VEIILNGAAVLYSVRQLPEQEAHSALPLVQLRYPEMTAESWKTRMCELSEHGGGVAVAQCERGYFYGILLFEPKESPEGERVLNVMDIVALTLTGQENVRSLMLQWSDKQARDLGCERIDIRLS